jgi:beta-lactamase regulating signal transducer with metallopeptidase domain
MKSEISYAVIFTSAVVLTGAVLWSLAQQPFFAATEEIITSCKQVSYSLLSSRFHLRNGLTLVLLGLALKAIFSIGKTYLRLESLRRHQTVALTPRLKRLCQQHQLPLDRVALVKSADSLAMTLGIYQPKIIFSTGLLSQLTTKQLEAVVLHEAYHFRHHHPALFIWGELVSSTLFFLPSLHDLLQQMKYRLEANADLFAINSQQTSRFLKQAVIRNLDQASTPQFVPSFAASRVLEQRIASLTNHQAQIQFDLKKMLITLMVIGAGLVMMLPRPHTIQAQTNQTQNQSICGFLQCVSSCVQEELMSKSRD